MSGASDNNEDYEVGFGRAPKATRFKPGQSGNPKGRPKGSKNLSTDVQNALRQKLTLNINGESKKLTAQQVIILRQVEKALKGDPKAAAQLLGMAAIYNDDEPIDQRAQKHSKTDASIIKAFLARQHLQDKDGEKKPRPPKEPPPENA